MSIISDGLEIVNETSKNIGEFTKEVSSALVDIGKELVRTDDHIQAFRELGNEIGKEETEFHLPPPTAEEQARRERWDRAQKQFDEVMSRREHAYSQEQDLTR